MPMPLGGSKIHNWAGLATVGFCFCDAPSAFITTGFFRVTGVSLDRTVSTEILPWLVLYFLGLQAFAAVPAFACGTAPKVALR